MGGKIVIEKWGFSRQKKKGKTDSPELRRNNFEEGYIQKRKLNEVALSTVSKPSLEQVHEKLRLEAPES